MSLIDHKAGVAQAAHDSHGGGENHGSLRDYLTGFGLAAVLTAVPFGLVMTHVFSKLTTALMIMVLAAVQMVVHMIYFLHMDTKSEQGWSFMALVFTLILVVIALTGSLWVMYHLNLNMLPMDMSQVP